MPRIHKMRVHTGGTVRMNIDDVFEIIGGEESPLFKDYPCGVRWYDSLDKGQYHYYGVMEETAVKLSQLTGLPIVEKFGQSLVPQERGIVGIQKEFKAYLKDEIKQEVEQNERAKTQSNRICHDREKEESQLCLLQ